MSLARLYGRGLVTEMRLADLRVGEVEAERFLAANLPQAVPAAAVSTLVARTEGWVTGLTPTVAALTSKRTTFEQGITMGISNAYTSLGRIVGPLLAGIALDVSLELPMLLAAGVMLAGAVASQLWLRGTAAPAPTNG